MNISKPPCPTCLQFQDFLPSTSSSKLYLNLAQSVMVTCPDGSTPLVNIPAGVIGYVLNFSIGTPPYPDLVLNCVGGQIIVPVPDDADQAELDSLIQSLLNQCVNKVALQSGCVAGSFVSVQQQVSCSGGLFVSVPGALPVGVTVSQDGHSLVATAGLIAGTISVADANDKAVQLLKELLATGNAICTTVTPPVTPVPVPDKLWYKFVEGTGTTTVDFSASANNGRDIFSGITWSTGPTGGGALDFAGTNGFESTGPVNVAAGDFTYNLWVQPVGSPTSSNFFDMILMLGFPPALNFTIDSSLTLRFQALAHTNTGGSSTNIGAGAWTMVTFTFVNATGTMSFYINGVLSGSSTTGATLTDPGFTCDIGGLTGPGGDYFTGKIADVRIWSQALTAAFVTDIYAIGAQ